MITPQGIIRLIHCPLTLDNKNQLHFKNEQDQYNYFSNLDGVELDSSTYVRRDNVIRFNDYPENIMDFNYCMYQNVGYSGRWFYAFVTKKEYVNDNMCYVYIETDSFQTWQFHINFKPSFVEREMILHDTIGNNTVPENIEVGEYTTTLTKRTDILNDTVWVMQVSEFLDGNKPLATNYGGVWMARWCLCY